jgi:hypothetical protein
MAEQWPNLDTFNMIVQGKRSALTQLIKTLEEKMLEEFDSKSDAMLKESNARYPAEMSREQILDKAIPFNDFAAHALSRVGNAIFKKEILNDVVTQMVAHSDKVLTKEKAIEAKKKFDLICDYSKRKEIGENEVGKYYDTDLCLYLMNKTFKKSALGAFEALYLVQPQLKKHLADYKANEISLASLGGGPGSDLIGILSHTCELLGPSYKSRKFDLNVCDIQAKEWEEAAQTPLTWGLYKHLTNNSMLIGEKVNFHKMDFKNKSTLDGFGLEKQLLISCCWALNESEFNPEFWTAVVSRTPQAILVFVEGKEHQLLKIHDIGVHFGRTAVFDLYESPRRLIILAKPTGA